jgi:hypothetical protein
MSWEKTLGAEAKSALDKKDMEIITIEVPDDLARARARY